MSGAFALVAGGAPADDIADAMVMIEVEENADAPGAFALTLPMSVSGGEPAWVGDERLAPMAAIAVVARANGAADECIFDGYVLSHMLNPKPGMVDARLRVWGQDASWLMNLDERAREWPDVSDATVADAIFGDYAIVPDPANSADDSPLHSEAGHTLMQRATDAQFLMRLARRSGKLFRVRSGAVPEMRTGVFARPELGGSTVVALNVGDIDRANVADVEISWDVMRPNAVSGGQALTSANTPATASVTSGLSPLDARGLADFNPQGGSALIAATVDEGSELTQRAQAALIDAGLFVRATGTADVARLGAVLRVGSLVSLDAVGSVHSGAWYVWSVRHTITNERHAMRFELVRNAVGPAPGASLLGGLGL
jgi:hypothetical protein